MANEDHYMGEICLFAHGTIPWGWRCCNGQLLNVAQYTIFFSVISNRFGGDGIKNFALPNLNGRAAVGAGAGPGLTDRPLAKSLGTEGAYVFVENMPRHKHAMRGVELRGKTLQAEGCSFANSVVGSGVGTSVDGYYMTLRNGQVSLGADSISYACKPGKHDNLQPYLALQYCIALVGLYPPRAGD